MSHYDPTTSTLTLRLFEKAKRRIDVQSSVIVAGHVTKSSCGAVMAMRPRLKCVAAATTRSCATPIVRSAGQYVCVSSSENAVTAAVPSVTPRTLCERVRRRELQCRGLSAADLMGAAEDEQHGLGNCEGRHAQDDAQRLDLADRAQDRLQRLANRRLVFAALRVGDDDRGRRDRDRADQQACVMR